MGENQESRRNWRANWLRSIQEFSDDEAQRRLWLDPTNTNPHFSFVECMCCYFDDVLRPDAGYDWPLNEGFVSADEVATVADFHQIADTYDSPTDDYDDQAILADLRWAEVVAAAKRARTALLSITDDPHERRLLGEP